MALLLKLVYDVARVRSAYTRIHEEVCGLPARSLMRRFLLRGGADLEQYQADLQSLCAELESVRQTLAGLKASDLGVRRGEDIRKALSDYAEALEESVGRLGGICVEQCRGDTVKPSPGQDTLRSGKTAADRRAYDDAIQHHRHMGARLTDLLSTF